MALWVRAAGAQSGVLINGGANSGTISASGANLTNIWTFTANPGDNVALRLGTTNFTGGLGVYGPDGALIGLGAGEDVPVIFAATNSGVFTAVVASYNPPGAGSYTLRLAQFAQPFAVPATPLANGGDNDGTLVLAGLDRWTFTANAGDNVLMRFGTTSFAGVLNVYGPDGALLSTGAGQDVPSIFTPTNSGAFTALVTSYESGGVGAYVLRLAHLPGVFVAPAVALTNGGDNDGTLVVAGLDRWTFTANTGDNVLLRFGTTNFAGILNVYGPNGALLSSGAGQDVPFTFTAANSGAFTALVTSYNPGGAGVYVLRLAHLPAVFAVPAPALTNGGDNGGTLSLAGLDRWTFTANAGNSVSLRLGTTNFIGGLSVYGPDGALAGVGGGQDVLVSFTPTNSGAFTAVVASYNPGGVGAYVLRLARLPGVFVVPGGSAGGSFAGGPNYAGAIGLGGQQLWSFTACNGDFINLTLMPTNFPGMFNLYGPDGSLLGTDVSTNLASIAVTATNCGTFTVLVGSYAPGGSGTYGLTAAGLSDGVRVCPPAVAPASFTLSGVGGLTNANAIFVLYSAMTLPAPPAFWSPVYTNQFDQTGVFNYTNGGGPPAPQQYFRLVARP